MTGIELESPAFADHDPIPSRHAGDGDDVSPPLVWTGVPDDARELALLCEDPDAPGGSFVHWLVTGIVPEDGGVDAGATPAGGVPHQNGFRAEGWGGPRPPAGDPPHRYLFRLYALPESVVLPPRPTAADVHAVVDRRQLASGTLIGVYQR